MAAAVGDNMDLSGRAFMQDPSAPDPVRPHAGNNASRDAFNDPYNYDAQIDDVFRDANETNHTANSTGRNDEREVDLFKEVQQDRKPRAKQAKLDEQRLLSPKGIPALRKISKERLKFRGKGHEFSDVARLLNNYQLWLDDLFPKAKFADGLAIIEKLGHSRKLQVMRREWIEEGKPKPVEPELSDNGGVFVDPSTAPSDPRDNLVQTQDEMNVESDRAHQLPTTESANDDDDSELNSAPLQPPPCTDGGDPGSELYENEHSRLTGEELDQLIAEEGAMTGESQSLKERGPEPSDQFADDEEAMAAMGMDW